jgi:hypothetical protein
MLSDQEILTQIIKDFELAGITKNDNILIHSSISRLLFNLIKKGDALSRQPIKFNSSIIN